LVKVICFLNSRELGELEDELGERSREERKLRLYCSPAFVKIVQKHSDINTKDQFFLFMRFLCVLYEWLFLNVLNVFLHASTCVSCLCE